MLWDWSVKLDSARTPTRDPATLTECLAPLDVRHTLGFYP
jgi:hypothetical protein